MKKRTVSQLKKQADALFSKAVRMRDADKYGMVECITCGVRKNWKEVQNGHFVSRICNVLRYDEENCNAQCLGCNMFHGGEQYLYAKNLDLKYGSGTAERLMKQRHDTHKFTTEELETIIHDAKECIKFIDIT
jgi:hypothetical protein